jgi:fluoride exporter
MRHSLQSADQLLGDADSSVLAQLIDSGDRVLAPEDDFGEDTTSVSDHHKVGPLPVLEDATMNNNGKVAAAPTSSMDSKYTISTVPENSSAKVMT